MKVAVICNDVYHPSNIIERGIAALDVADVEWEFIHDTTEWPARNFDRFDVILLSKGNSRTDTDFTHWLTPEIQRGFVDFVEGGRGLFVIHSGLVGYRDESLFRDLVGGVFTRHPEQCDVTVHTTAGSRATDPTAADFTERDEHYFVDTFGDDLSLFLQSTSTDGVQPAGWTREQGRGRVCVLTPGHNLGVWLNAEYQKRIIAALEWCGGRVQ